MRRLFLGLTVAGLLLTAAPLAAAGKIAPSSTEIQPLLIGEELPKLVLKTGDGADYDLNAAVARQPTVLIVYRGGW